MCTFISLSPSLPILILLNYSYADRNFIDLSEMQKWKIFFPITELNFACILIWGLREKFIITWMISCFPSAGNRFVFFLRDGKTALPSSNSSSPIFLTLWLMAEAGKLFHLLNVVGSVEHSFSVMTTQLCHCSMKTPVQYVEERVWLCMNKALFTKTCDRPCLLILDS